MRAPVQKKRPRGNSGGHHESPAEPQKSGVKGPAATALVRTPGAPAEVPGGRRARVRNRLIAGVAVVGITVIGAGAPGVLRVSADLTDAQRLVTLAELNRQAVTLAHSLADERDDVVVSIAAGRDSGDDSGESGTRTESSGGGSDGESGKGGKNSSADKQADDDPSTRVDRQIDEIRATAPAGLVQDLATVPTIRRTALTGKGSALDAYRAYSDVIAKLHALADELAEKTPAGAADGSRAPAALDRAVDQASATRGLLLAALAVPGGAGPQLDPVSGLPVSTQGGDSEKDDKTRDALSAAAQQAHVRELSALADFDETAEPQARDSLANTVTGPDVKAAEDYLNRLVDEPRLSDSDRESDPDKVDSALSARIDQMRGVESGLGSAQVARLTTLRDDAVTTLELRIALLGGCLLIAIGVTTAFSRTLTRPLAVLRIGAARLAADPQHEEPVRFTGRNDEFAQVVRSLNTLHGKLLELSTRADKLDSDRSDLIGAREKVVEHRGELQQQTAAITAQLEQLRHTVHHTFVNLSLRTLGLVDRQLGVIEGLEEREQDPERLDVLFKLDHMATVIRRHSENLLVLADHEHGHSPTGPVPLVDVLRAAVSEIERYERVTIQSLPPHAQVVGFAADDLSHLVAELLENATSFSPPDAQVQLSGWLLESGEVMLSVEDQGIGMSAERLAEANARLAGPESQENPESPENPEDADASENAASGKDQKKSQKARKKKRQQRAYGAESEGLGLRVAALLAARHGVRIELREHQDGGLAAVVVLPEALLPTSPPVAVHQARTAGAAPAFTLPGSVAEANSNALPGRGDAGVDPLVAAAERSIQQAEAQQAEAQQAGVQQAEAQAQPEDHADELPESEPEAHPAPEPLPKRAAPAPTAQPAAVPDTALPTPYAIGPDTHERTPDGEPDTAATSGTTATGTTPDPTPGIPTPTPEPAEPLSTGPDQDTFTMRLPQQRATPAPAAPETTTNGLPQRTPKISRPAVSSSERTGSVDAEALRARLGGFHQGAKDGRRDVEAELTEETQQVEQVEQVEQTQQADQKDQRDQRNQRDQTGETVEEARS